MLTPEQAREALERFAVSPEDRRNRRGLLLPGKTAQAVAAARMAVDRGSGAFDRVAQAMDELSDRSRRRAFRYLHPTLGDLLSEAWPRLHTDPYTHGFFRRPFRVPGHPEASRFPRAIWLINLLGHCSPYEQPPAWFAEWAGWLDSGTELGRLLGVAVDIGEPGVYERLLGTLNGDQEVAVMGRHVPVALLSCARPDAWEAVGQLLLAAQRQEGLRQVILEAVDFAHPMAFRRILRLIVERGLTRHSATIRAVGTWLGESFDVSQRKVVDGILADLVVLLDDEAARMRTLVGDDAGRAYLALWATGYEDALKAATMARSLLQDPRPDHRLAAAKMLSFMDLQTSQQALVWSLDDSDLRVVAVALRALTNYRWMHLNAFVGTRALLDRVVKPVTVPIGIWTDQQDRLDPATIADRLIWGLSVRPVTDLADVLPRMSPDGRQEYVRKLAAEPSKHRSALLAMVGDNSSHVREEIFRALADQPAPTEAEAQALELLLRRRSGDLRAGVIKLLLRQPKARALASVDRLRSGTEAQLEAAEEIRRQLEPARSGTTAPRAQSPYDLVDHDARTVPIRPTATLDVLRRSNRTVTTILTSLDAWLAEHRDVEVEVQSWSGPELRLLSNLQHLPDPHDEQPWEEQSRHFPLHDLVAPWWERVSPQLTDGGLEVTFAAAAAAAALSVDYAWSIRSWGHESVPPWAQELADAMALRPVVAKLNYGPIIVPLLRWFASSELRTTWVPALLDAAEGMIAAVPQRSIDALPPLAEHHVVGFGHSATFDWRQRLVPQWFREAARLESTRPELWTPSHRGRLWTLARYIDEPRGMYDPRTGARDTVATNEFQSVASTTTVPHRPARDWASLGLTVRAIEDQVADRADLVDLLVGERHQVDNGPSIAYGPLRDLTRRRRPILFDRHPWAADLVEEVTSAVVKAELTRGDLPTAYSSLAATISSTQGIDTFVQLLVALGRDKLVRGYARGEGKAGVLSHLIRVCFPRPGEKAAQFAEAVRGARLRETRLLEVAAYAPQWADFVEHALGRTGVANAIYWLHAHTKDVLWQVDEEIREGWTVEIHRRTPLEATDLLNGAVDVVWLRQVLDELGDDQFDATLKVAKYASSSGGHSRATLFAQAVRGQVDKDELLSRIETKRHQDSVRALGLLPLPEDPEAARAELLDRYEFLQKWRAGSRTFGQQRRANEGLAFRIALDNLARTAGYLDPQRLTWAMEAEAIQDIVDGPLTSTEADVTVSLSLATDGMPTLTVRRGERVLASVPKTMQKTVGVVELKARAKALRDQFRRMRRSLEEASIRGDRFTPAEFAELLAHPMLAAMLRDLLVVTDEGVVGRPASATTLLGADGAAVPFDGSAIRIAHPVDLLETGVWQQWQRSCFEGRIRQPFKQVFRELYVPTAAERQGATRSERYSGHQVNPRQATALLGSRGWLVTRDADAMRTFHDARLTVSIEELTGYLTPAEVEDLTLGAVVFTPIGRWEPVPLEEVPPRLFSEAMRDLDLVVSVAHSGGVDPEASMSTIELRAALVEETAELLGMDNVELTEHHVLVNGKLGSYSIHLGSGVVHRRPGNALCIVPVSSQHRGRVFLPFADDDPRTAEVIAKVVMLARDDKIKDPTILEQLR